MAMQRNSLSAGRSSRLLGGIPRLCGETMFHDLLREKSLRGAVTRLAVFTYLALGGSWFLVNLFSPYFNNFHRHPVWLATSWGLTLVSSLVILFARSVTARWLGALLLCVGIVALLFQPDGGLQ